MMIRINMIMSKLLILSCLFVNGCAYVEPGNPYDPDTIYDQRAVGFVSGSVVAPQGSTNFPLSQIVITLHPLSQDEPTLQLTPSHDGAFNFSLVHAGYLELDAQAEIDGILYGLAETQIFLLNPNERKNLPKLSILKLSGE
jgi:hypothetical protein